LDERSISGLFEINGDRFTRSRRFSSATILNRNAVSRRRVAHLTLLAILRGTALAVTAQAHVMKSTLICVLALLSVIIVALASGKVAFLTKLAYGVS
jgi:hypothetical protein